jgi:hypothetical protein
LVISVTYEVPFASTLPEKLASPLAETVVNAPVEAVVAPIDVLLIVLAAVGLIVKAPTGLIVTVPVPVGLIAMFALAGDNVTVLLAVSVVNDPAFAAVPPIAGGDAR